MLAPDKILSIFSTLKKKIEENKSETLEELADKLKLAVIRLSFKNEKIKGMVTIDQRFFLKPDNHEGLIAVSDRLNKKYYKITLGHELAHYILHGSELEQKLMLFDSESADILDFEADLGGCFLLEQIEQCDN